MAFFFFFFFFDDDDGRQFVPGEGEGGGTASSAFGRIGVRD